jgi:hypothetical protein
LDVNFINMRPAQDAQEYVFTRTVASETATAATVYPRLPSVEDVGLEVGLHATSQFGVGVTFGGVNYEYNVGLGVNIPHPTMFNRHASATSTTSSRLERRDRALDFSLIYLPRTPDAVKVRLFGGPTYFWVRQQMVSLINYEQEYTFGGLNLVDITTFEQEEPTGSVWGFHAGADVAWFFSRHVGVGGVVRLNVGTADVDDPLSGESAELKVGRATVGGGLRVRF